MADQVQPRNSPLSQKAQSPAAAKSSLPVGAYHVKVPKHFHPTETSRRYPHYNRREPSRCGCCCFLCWLISIIIVLAVLLGAATGVFYLVFQPEAPAYTIQRVAVKGVNLTSSAFSPEFDVVVRAYNGNDKIGIYYEEGSSVAMFYNDARLCDGVFPAFYQPSNNVTLLEALLKGNDVELMVSDQTGLVMAVTDRSVPLKLELQVAAKIKVGSVTTWKISVRVECDVTVDELTVQARIVKRDCGYRFDLW
ncbi:hypothetical protein PHAVU_L001637 [Phaseolus vulgaris]|uniref:Late embryogenesis abundant protein LEA-2 subgroup domain-containing protein n=2 Tax=Phaseolus vulgaris TaxID=3885 RepID=V7BND4_PHAVU|nr:hypothetical protein PHAVU_006G011100g [Phaseolus vulgaris]ESW18076.1 hypothetical protein PHAVU_006G011100g [Phaseolus vulgaris]